MTMTLAISHPYWPIAQLDWEVQIYGLCKKARWIAWRLRGPLALIHQNRHPRRLLILYPHSLTTHFICNMACKMTTPTQPRLPVDRSRVPHRATRLLKDEMPLNKKRFDGASRRTERKEREIGEGKELTAPVMTELTQGYVNCSRLNWIRRTPSPSVVSVCTFTASGVLSVP